MTTKSLALAMLSSLLLAADVHSQTSPGTTTAPEKPVQTSPTADNTFKPLGDAFERLYMSLQNKGGVGKEDRPAIEALRTRIAAFSKQFPDDSRGPAAELYLSIWLDDQPRVDELYGEILRTRPTDLQTRLMYARRLEEKNRYAKVIEVLNAGTWDDVNIVDARLMLSNAMMAEHRFQDSVDILQSIPESAWNSNLSRKSEVTNAIVQRQEYVALWTAEQVLRDAEQKADDLPEVKIVTARGPIVVELFENEAPNTVANFIKLADSKFYDGSKFHRVMANFMAQGGDPNTKPGGSGTPGMGNPGYFIADEVSRPNARNHFSGSLAMAKSPDPDSGGCQFYLTHLPTPWLNGKHTVFGRVVSGEDIVRAMKQEDVIETIIVMRKRDHAYEPTTLPLVKTPATVPATIPATTQGGTPETAIPITLDSSGNFPSTVPATQP